MNQNRVRNRYVADGLANASGIQIIALLYERMLRDLSDAEHALRNSDWDKVNTSLCHAQDIVIELKACLDPTKWDAGPTLAAIYDYLVDRLIQANVQKDRKILAECKKVIEPIADAWSQVAKQAGNNAPPMVGYAKWDKMTMSQWEEILNRWERKVSVSEQALEDKATWEDATADEISVDDTLGPPPRELYARYEMLAQRTKALEQRLAQAGSELSVQLAAIAEAKSSHRVPSKAFSTSAPSSYIDQHS